MNSNQERNEQYAAVVAQVREDENLPAWQRDRSVPVPVPGKATRVASWIGWHFMELTGVTVPAAFAVAATPWAWLVSGVVGAGWAVHELRTATEQAQLRTELNARRAAAAHEVVGSAAADSVDGPAPDDDFGTESTEDGTASGATGGSGGAA